MNELIENKSIMKLNNVKRLKSYQLTRKNVNLLKKYVLLYIVRNPVYLERLIDTWLNESPTYLPKVTDDRLEGESFDDFWLRVINETIDSDLENIESASLSAVRRLIALMQRTFPVIVKSKGELVLPDVAIVRDECVFDTIKGDYTSVIEKIDGRSYSQGIQQASDKGLWLNSYILPFDPHYALIFVDDIWRPWSKYSIHPSNNIDSIFKNFYKYPSITYVNRKQFETDFNYLQDVQKYFTLADSFNIKIIELDELSSCALSYLTICASERYFCFFNSLPNQDFSELLKHLDPNGEHVRILQKIRMIKVNREVDWDSNFCVAYN